MKNYISKGIIDMEVSVKNGEVSILASVPVVSADGKTEYIIEKVGWHKVGAVIREYDKDPTEPPPVNCCIIYYDTRGNLYSVCIGGDAEYRYFEKKVSDWNNKISIKKNEH